MKPKMRIRRAKITDIPELLGIDEEAWPQFRASMEMFRSRIETFPQGQMVAVTNKRVIGSLSSQLVSYADWERRSFTWNEVTDFGTLRRTHNPRGDSVYGVGLAVAREFHGSPASQLLITGIVRLTIRMNRPRILLGSRIPAYHKSPGVPVEEYIRATRGTTGRLRDPELAIYQRYGGEPIRPLPNYIPDPESLNYGVLVKWKNPFHGKLYYPLVAWLLKMFPRMFR